MNEFEIFLPAAGCGAEILINNVRVFGNCTCGVDTQLPMEDLIATEGACGMDDCQPFWIAHQALSVMAAALLGSTLIGKLIISLRAVLPQDKSVALSIELMLIGIVVYLPGKLGYRFIAGKKSETFSSNFLIVIQLNRPNMPICCAGSISMLSSRVADLR